MSENFDGDIYEKIEYMPITFFANTLRVGIIGGGRGSYIKARTLSNSGVEVEVLSREFIEDFHNISVTLIKKEYDKKFIEDKHIVIIAISDEETINNFRNSIRPNTRLVICTHASNVFGVRLPVERIAALCRIHGILFCVDAAQTAGVVPISLKDSCIDFLCTAGHKGLYGPMGTGILAINSETLPESLIQGGTGSFSSDRKQPAILPDRYESGTPNLPGIAGLNEGIKFVMKRTERGIERYESDLAVRLYHKLKNISGVVLYTDSPETHRCVPVISFNIEGLDSEETAEILDKRFNIAVRAGLHCAPLAHEFFGTQESGTVRAVLSVFSNCEQVDYFASSIRTINKFKKELKKVAIDI